MSFLDWDPASYFWRSLRGERGFCRRPSTVSTQFLYPSYRSELQRRFKTSIHTQIMKHAENLILSPGGRARPQPLLRGLFPRQWASPRWDGHRPLEQHGECRAVTDQGEAERPVFWFERIPLPVFNSWSLSGGSSRTTTSRTIAPRSTVPLRYEWRIHLLPFHSLIYLVNSLI